MRDTILKLAETRSRKEAKELIENIYNVYSDKLDSLLNGKLSTKDNFYIHIVYTMKILSRRLDNNAELCFIKKIAYALLEVYDIIGEYDDLRFDRLNSNQILNVCISLKSLIMYTKINTGKGSCIYDLIPVKKDREIFNKYFSNNKICMA